MWPLILENIDYIIAIFTTLFAVAGMQFKSMRIILVSQIIANGLLATQAIIGGTASASITVFVAIVQTVISFVYTSSGKGFPIWLTSIFIVVYTAVTIVCFKTGFDLLILFAAVFFALAVVQKKSSICRFCSLVNCLLWLSYDIAVMPSGIITHVVIVSFTLAAIIRLDRGEWKSLLTKVFTKNKNSEEIE